MKIKVGYLISYDYELVFTSINQLYEYVDVIYLAIDINRTTWNGNKFELPHSFFEKVEVVDVSNKIILFEADFCISNLTPIENETRERNLLQKKMGNGWKIQLDVDEYIYDFEVLKKYLEQYSNLLIFPWLTPIIFRGRMITLFKQTEQGFLFIENNERFSFVSNIKKYRHTRNNERISTHFTNIIAIHQSWARSDHEILQKINNWGHTNDYDTRKYFNFWKSLNIKNYKSFHDFHPSVPKYWDKLNYIEANNIDEFIEIYERNNTQQLINLEASYKVRLFLERISKLSFIVFCKNFNLEKRIRKFFRKVRLKLSIWFQ